MKKSITDFIEVPRSFYIPHPRHFAPVADPATGEILPSKTEQEHLAACDINNIIKQFSKTGVLTHISANAAKGAYLDLPDPTDFQEAQNIMLEANAAFASLPSKVRDRFENDPARFLTFMADPKNEKEARELGLLTPAPPPPEPKADAPKGDQ